MRYLTLSLIVLAATGTFAQSRRVPAAGPVNQSPAVQSSDNAQGVKQLYSEADGYIKTKLSELEQKKTPVTEAFLNKARLEQRQLAAKYAAIASARGNLAGADIYYLGLLHWIAENLDGTAENLRKFIALGDADAGRRQTARSVVAIVLAKQKKLDEAEALLADYIKSEPAKVSERGRVEGELAKAYQSKNDFARMAPHAEQYYKAAKAMLSDASSRARGIDEVHDAGMLVFEAYRDGGDRPKAEAALDDLRSAAVDAGASTLYVIAVDQKIRFLIDTGRKPQAMDLYAAAIDGAKALPAKEIEADAVARLKRKEKHYKLLGLPAPEFSDVSIWFPGDARTFASMKGKVVLIDFWATWCGPCVDAFPSLREWRQEFGRDGFEIFGVTRYYGNVRGMPADKPSELEYLKQYRTNQDLPYPIIVGDGQAMQLQYGATGLPTAVLIDRKGVVRYIESGTSTQRLAQLRAMIVKLLDEK